MKTRLLYLASLALLAMPAAAQETYENTKLIDNDLNGTARYVGMGGAMEALGADISTMSTNPAGVGLFRKSKVDGSLSVTSQEKYKSFGNADKTALSFDQLGIVYSMKQWNGSYLNFGFNYHKSRNFNQILGAASALNGASQNKLTYLKLSKGVVESTNDLNYTQVDYLYDSHLIGEDGEIDGKPVRTYYYYPADRYIFDSGDKGYIGEYDFNVSGNLGNRWYLGLTVGIHDVHYNGYSEYAEHLEENAEGIDNMALIDSRKITGTGFDVKLGAIFRPIESSPFRIGAYIHTPTFYDLTTSNYTVLTAGKDAFNSSESLSFKVNTPWKFGLSLGHTVDNVLALGVTYEYADYGSMDSREKDGSYYDSWYGDYYETSSSDKSMNRHTERTLKGVHTLKVGGEVKVTPHFAVRAGYNYLSGMYDMNDGYKDGTIYSQGSYYASQTAYTNWKATNRLTCGVGYSFNNFNIDFAYQYSTTKGEFHPFMNYFAGADEPENNNVASGVDVKNNRYQFLMTVGYRF
ncbi:MAG: hemin receptor [Prevotella sp.]|nr:hemin receptor [Prevotella sp.]